MCIPSKPNKYGLKMQCLADAKTHYVYNTYLYCGKNADGLTLTEEKKQPIPLQTCLRLYQTILSSNRNITIDNWFTKDFTIANYVPKKNKSVLLVSSMHDGNSMDESTNKPEIILQYNSTKAGVNAVDQMYSVYSSSRRTRRWPMPILYRLLDISALNAYIIQQSHERASKMTRMTFLKGLTKSLCEPYMKERCYNQRLPAQLRTNIATALQIRLPTPSEPGESQKLDRNKRKRCSFCKPVKRAKTVHLCICMTCAKLFAVPTCL
ncbi:PiggyBac transposable element-derived protein 4 [Eumeta japonica]|uniref:PiggyBac transposable element-derived protein 4 n=1 Tax=Eumeta variegata TaxID=151549 RepID=A0A4C1ZIA1_EUMVA|nr:PiggyBac transposable element-derived protein 4 [Eumeta japonica]